MLEALSLSKSYGKRTVVADLSIAVGAGEIVGLLGPNGAGKTTTVAMLTGLVAPDRGQVHVGSGADRGELTGRSGEALRRRIGVVPQELAIYDNLSARANLELFGALYGLAGERLRERISAVLALVGLADRAHEKAANFSGGMKRRLNIACALVHDPDVLIFDEPTVGVDPQSRNAIFDNLEALRARGKALLYTTHYMEEAERLCDRVVIVDHGKVVASDTLAGIERLVPATQGLEIELDGDAAERIDVAALAALAGVGHVERRGAALHAVVEDLGRDAPTLFAAIAARGGKVSRVASTRAGLEDVFLALTGRQLRD